MHVFVTGATGFVGSAVVKELIAGGHQVLGLTRSERGVEELTRRGAGVHRGSLEDLDSLRNGAALADAVIHTAFDHDFSHFAESCEKDRRAIEAIGSALEGTDKPLLATSGLAVARKGPVAVESDSAVAPSPSYPRKSEAAVAALVERGIRASVVRLPSSVHGKGDHAFVPMLIAMAREKGTAAYVGDGNNRWAGVHRADAARVFRLALEHGVHDGPFHAVADEGVLMRHIAEIIGRRLNVPVVSLSAEEASAYFGWFLGFAGGDMAGSSRYTRKLLNWTPAEIGLLKDIDSDHYFTTPTVA